MKMQSGVLAAAMFFAAPLVYGDSDGSNSTGTEKVCEVNNRTNETLNASLSKCKRGDIIPLEGMSVAGVMQLCDFTKSIVMADQYPVACVYPGKRRRVGE